MVSAGDAAFRILEILAILLPLLFIVIRVFLSQLLENEASPIVSSNNVLFFVYGAILLMITAVFASSVLVNELTSLTLKFAILALYIGFILITYPITVMGVSLYNMAEEQSEQVDLSASITEAVTRERELEDERNDA